MPCDACRAEVSRETLHLTAEGQALCRQCYGTYLSRRATLNARAHEVYRRCGCGAVVSPTADPPTTLFVNDKQSEVDAFFRPRSYDCGSCGRSFGVLHPLVPSLGIVAILCSCFYALARSAHDEGVSWLLVLLGFLPVVAYDAYCRIRHPRVVTED